MTEWVGKDEAKARTGMSDSTLERRVKDGSLRREYRSVPGRKSEPVFAAEDLEKLKKAKIPIVLKTAPRKPLRDAGNLPALLQQNGKLPSHQSLILSVPLDKKLFLTLPEACAYSGLPRVFLQEQIDAKKLKVLKRGRYFISRRALEEMKV